MVNARPFQILGKLRHSKQDIGSSWNQFIFERTYSSSIVEAESRKFSFFIFSCQDQASVGDHQIWNQLSMFLKSQTVTRRSWDTSRIADMNYLFKVPVEESIFNIHLVNGHFVVNPKRKSSSKCRRKTGRGIHLILVDACLLSTTWAHNLALNLIRLSNFFRNTQMVPRRLAPFGVGRCPRLQGNPWKLIQDWWLLAIEPNWEMPWLHGTFLELMCWWKKLQTWKKLLCRSNSGRLHYTTLCGQNR